MRETGFHDARGIPICVGDLVRVRHFQHYRRREQMWIYLRVGELDGVFVVYRWDQNDGDQHQCLLEHCGGIWAGRDGGSIEVLDGDSWRNPKGELMMWNERPRKKTKEVSGGHN